jgi:hypothetical protein
MYKIVFSRNVAMESSIISLFCLKMQIRILSSSFPLSMLIPASPMGGWRLGLGLFFIGGGGFEFSISIKFKSCISTIVKQVYFLYKFIEFKNYKHHRTWHKNLPRIQRNEKKNYKSQKH